MNCCANFGNLNGSCAQLLWAMIFVLLTTVLTGAPGLAEDQTQALYKTAEQLYRAGQVVAARRMLQSLIHRPDARVTPAMYCLYADSYLEDLEERDGASIGARDAEQGLYKALRIDPECGRAYKDLASFCNVRGDYQAAVVNATKAIQAKESEVYGYLHRSAAYSHLHEQEKALRDMDEFMKRGQPVKLHYMLRGDILLSLHRYDEAVSNYRRALSGKAGYQILLVHKIVQCLEAEHKYDEAITEVSSYLKVDRDNAQCLALRAQLEKENKDYKSAVADLSKAISIEPTSKYFKDRAEVYTILGRKDLAEKDLHSAEF
jgi:tetratricopeptide (TPR) repeat protein